MIVTFKLFASLAAHLPPENRRANQTRLEVPEGCTVQDMIERFSVPPALCTLVLVNGVFVAREALADTALAEGDVLAIWPPVGGG
jgi:thiamine biosynthesis protein ThiS